MSHLLWELTKNNNSFLVKRNGVQFSADPYNLINRNQYSYSGLAHSWSMVSINAPKRTGEKSGAPARHDIRFTKKRNFAQKTRVTKEAKTINANQRYSFFEEHVPAKGIHTAAKVIRKRLATGRGDLLRAALRRLAITHRANVVKKVLAKTPAAK